MSTENQNIDQVDVRTPLTDYSIIIPTLTGTVKWFNNKAGFGFITVCEEGEFKDKDIFVHYSSIRVSNSQYKYLVQGEYVDFTLVKANSDTHEFQAMNVSGVKGGPIMCEIRRSLTPSAVGGDSRALFNGEDRPHRKNSRPRETRPPIDNEVRRPRKSNIGANAPSENREPRETREPTTVISGDDMIGFTKVERKRTSRAKA